MSKLRVRRLGSMLTALIVAGAMGCTAEPAGGDGPGPGGGKADGLIPTAGLEMLADVGSQETLEALFHFSGVDQPSTIDMVVEEMEARGADTLQIKGEGIPVFTDLFDGVDLRLGRGLSGIARGVWSGKVFTFSFADDGSLVATLENAILDTEIIEATLSIQTMAEAMKARGEDDPEARMPKFGINETPVEVDDELSVILDYELTSPSIFSSIIDEIRPVTREGLAAAGIDVDDDVDISDLWLGRATALFGFGEKHREFIVYFALHFDRDSIVTE